MEALGISTEVGVSGVVVRSLAAGVGRDVWERSGEDDPEGSGAERGAV